MVAQRMNEVALKYSSSHNTLVMVRVHYTFLLSTYKQSKKAMIQSDKIALHYTVIANTAKKIERVSKELSTLYKDSFFNEKRANLRKEHLKKYIKELEELLNEN